MIRRLIRLIVIGMALAPVAACTRVDPGYAGVEVHYSGSQKNAKDFPIVHGWDFYMPGTARVYEYSTFTQTYNWTKSHDEGKEADESLNFNSAENILVNVDLGISYSFVDDSVAAVFVKYRKEPQQLTDGQIRNAVRDGLSIYGPTYKIGDIFGGGKAKLLEDVRRFTQSRMGGAFNIENISMLNQPRVDPSIMQAITQTVQARQQAAVSEANVQRVKAEAEQKVALAQGDSAAAVIRAAGQAAANSKLLEKLTPELIKMKMIEKWDGALPHYAGAGATMMIDPTKQQEGSANPARQAC